MERFAQIISKNWIVLAILGALSIVLGVFGLVAPQSLAPRFMALIGGLFIASGAISLFRGIQSKSPTNLVSLVLVILGIILVVMPESSASVALGIIGLSLGFFGFIGGSLLLLVRRFTRLGAFPAASAFIVGIIGVMILFNTQQSLNIIMSVGGLILLSLIHI